MVVVLLMILSFILIDTRGVGAVKKGNGKSWTYIFDDIHNNGQVIYCVPCNQKC